MKISLQVPFPFSCTSYLLLLSSYISLINGRAYLTYKYSECSRVFIIIIKYCHMLKFNLVYTRQTDRIVVLSFKLMVKIGPPLIDHPQSVA